MRIWPFRRRRALAMSAGTTYTLRPGEFPPDERQIGADLEQWLPQRSAHSRAARFRASSQASGRASSDSGRSSLWLILVLVGLAALAYFVFLAPEGVTLTTLWEDIIAVIEDLFAAVTPTGGGILEEITGGVGITDALEPAGKHSPPALITSTPGP